MPAGIRKIIIRNYKSISAAAVKLSPFSVLVGHNGAGKSNFVDALAFAQECVSESMELAFKNRGGIAAVRRKSIGHPTNLGIRMIIDLDQGGWADYAFEISAERDRKFRIKQERCQVKLWAHEETGFEVREGKFLKAIPGIKPKISPDRLALYAASATDDFRPVYDFLASMRFYSIVPKQVRELQEPDPGDFLKSDGSNSAAVLKRLSEGTEDRDRYELLCSLLSKIVEGVRKVEYRSLGQKETLRFKQDVGSDAPWTFDAWNMSDGTLRVLGLLLAIYQGGAHSLVAIEEPEATVHPAVTEILTEVIMDAANDRQIIITTHSPDLIDYKGLSEDQIISVNMIKGTTRLSPLAPSSRQSIREHLFTPGELLRADELQPDLEASQSESRQLDLFGPLHQEP